MMLPCDICGKQGHSWFQCPQRSTKPDGWKPPRLQKTGAKSAVTPAQDRPAQRAQGPEKSEGRQLSVSTSAAKGIDRRDSARSVRPTSELSTAARMDVHVGKMAAGDGAHSPSEAPAPPETLGHASAKPAGTQAPPVDTKSKGGRPRIHPDRKAYKAAKERERRARLKADQSKRED